MATISEFVGEFNRHHKQYVNIEKQVETICKEKLRARNVKFSWQSRVKKASSLEKKLRDRSHCYPTEAHNTADIKDLVAGRILLTRWKDLAHVEEIVKENFNLESRTQHPKSDSAQRSLTLQTRFRGYGGLHFYVRRKAPTDEKYSDLIIEIQVLSAIMYAWSELERDFQYKQLNGEQSRAIYLVLEALKGVTNSGEVLLELVEELEHDRDLDLPRIKDFVLENQNMILQQLQQSEKLNTKQKTLSSLGPDQIACLAALSPADPQHERKALVETKGVRVKGTCEWIKSSGPYEEWSKSTSSHILWITGGPGKGKTMTSMFLTEELEKQARQAPSTILLEYFCNNNDAAWNTALGIVRGSIYQLLHENETLWKYILRPYQTEVERQKQAKERGVPLKHEFFRNFSALWEIFQNMLQEQKQKRTYYILDGLDECDDESIEKILEALSKLYNTLPSDVFFKTILVSRVFPGNIRNPLNSVDSFKLDLDSGLNVHEDLQRFIAFEMEQNFKGTSISGPWRKSFESKVLKKAEGTFLWAEFAMRELRLKTCAEAEQILEGLPSGLDAMYGRMLLRILPRRRQSLIQILKWVVTAFRPLTLMELCDALCVDHFRFDSRGEAVLDHISQFGYILVTKDNTVNLVHQSVKDYLLRKEPGMNQDLACFRIVEEDAHATIMQSCIEYMQNGCLNDGPVVSPKGVSLTDTSLSQNFPLLSYSVFFWPKHAQALSHSTEAFDLSQPFFQENSPLRKS